MSRKNCLLGCLALALVGAGYVASRAGGADDKESPKKDGPAAAPTYKVEKGPFAVAVSLKGTLEAQEMAPVALSVEEWSPQGGGGPLVVKKAAEHGARVKKGETVVELDHDKIDQVILDLESEQHLAELAIKLAEKELPVLEQTVPLDLAAAERAKKIADEDLQRFVKTDREFSEKSADFMLKNARTYYEYAQEELKQLEKMYKADDLTEETEEIILKRQRNEVEMTAFWVKQAERQREETLKITLPRRDVQLRESAEKASLSLDRARSTLPLTVSQKKLALGKLRYDRAKAAERLARLKHDREAMTLKAPADGVVYHGRSVRGQWSTASATEKLRPGGQVVPDEVLVTIVGTGKVHVMAEVEEKDLHHLKTGMEGKVVPTGLPDLKVTAKLDSVSEIPVTPGRFAARFSVELPADAPVVPGMACTVKLVPYRKADALFLPASAVFADEADEDSQYVYVAGDGEPSKRAVKVGKRSGTKVEIVEGLKEGDKVLRQKPEDKEGKP